MSKHWCLECGHELNTQHDPGCGKRVVGCSTVVFDDCHDDDTNEEIIHVVPLGIVGSVAWQLNTDIGCITPCITMPISVASLGQGLIPEGCSRFWIGNPPSEPEALELFLKLCNRGVESGYMRRCHVFAVVK